MSHSRINSRLKDMQWDFNTTDACAVALAKACHLYPLTSAQLSEDQNVAKPEQDNSNVHYLFLENPNATLEQLLTLIGDTLLYKPRHDPSKKWVNNFFIYKAGAWHDYKDERISLSHFPPLSEEKREGSILILGKFAFNIALSWRKLEKQHLMSQHDRDDAKAESSSEESSEVRAPSSPLITQNKPSALSQSSSSQSSANIFATFRTNGGKLTVEQIENTTEEQISDLVSEEVGDEESDESEHDLKSQIRRYTPLLLSTMQAHHAAKQAATKAKEELATLLAKRRERVAEEMDSGIADLLNEQKRRRA